MLSYLKKKIALIKEENKITGASLPVIFFKKAAFYFFANSFLLLEIILLSPLVLLLVVPTMFLIKRFAKKKNIFFTGLEHVISKTAERAIEFERKGYSCYFFSYEWSGQQCSKEVYVPSITKYSFSLLWDTIVFTTLLLKKKPVYIEVYNEGGNIRQFFSSLIARAFGCKIICIERGTLVNYLTNTMSLVHSIFLYLTYWVSNYVFYREPYMEKYLFGKIKHRKLFFDYNRVKIRSTPINAAKYKNKNVLFLNGFARIRRLELVVKSIPLLIERIPDIQFTFIGARNAEEKTYLERLAQESNVAKYIEIGDWTNQPTQYYEKASLFILPADIVFCNFSLLEAMERGLPPIVADVRDANRIVENGINGYLVKQEETVIAECIYNLITNEALMAKMGIQAREKVIQEFNSERRLEPIFDIIEKKEGKCVA